MVRITKKQLEKLAKMAMGKPRIVYEPKDVYEVLLDQKNHDSLKAKAILFLLKKGYSPQRIKTEYVSYEENNKRYVYDVVALGERDYSLKIKIVIECGEISPSKLKYLKTQKQFTFHHFKFPEQKRK